MACNLLELDFFIELHTKRNKDKKIWKNTYRYLQIKVYKLMKMIIKNCRVMMWYLY